MPAWVTAAAIARKTLGSSTPSAARTAQGMCGVTKVDGSGPAGQLQQHRDGDAARDAGQQIQHARRQRHVAPSTGW
ncbi:hypothetical protein G6F65_022936 [Rhizopus arrhizus]|nr:hypothetical protein G6F65_022936 [Rhizopus arrhizus]KAG1378565.1 hypothetical protein G6F59_018099 [Rhizopus arrhizus]